jgi:hypothetical protein
MAQPSLFARICSSTVGGDQVLKKTARFVGGSKSHDAKPLGRRLWRRRSNGFPFCGPFCDRLSGACAIFCSSSRIALPANDGTAAALHLFVVLHGLSLHKLLMAPVLMSHESEFKFKMSEAGLMRMGFQFRHAPRSDLSSFSGPPSTRDSFPR